MKTEVSNKEFSGDKFTCKLRQIDSTKWEFTIDEPIGMRDGNILHKIILKNDSKIKLSQVVDYKSTLTKYSDLTKKIEIVVFKPSSNMGYENWVLHKLLFCAINVIIRSKNFIRTNLLSTIK